MSDNKVRKVAAYLRVSTFRQRDEETIKTQERQIEDYTVANGIIVDEWFPDDGVTSSKSWEKRAQGSELIKKIRRGEISTLLVTKIDRLARSPRYVDDIIQACKSTKTKLILIRDGFDIESAMGVMMCTLIALFAQYEKEMIAERSAEGKRTKIAAGKFLGRPPFGYKVNENKQLELDPEKSETVKLIFDLYLQKGSMKAVAHELTRRGINTPTMSERGWMSSTIANILNHEVYSGTFRNYKSDQQYNFQKIGKRDEKDIIIHEVEPVVEKNIWLRVQDQIGENKAASTGANRSYLLSGLIRCGRCGHKFIGHTLKQNRKRPDGTMVYYPDLAYYLCTLKNANGSCQNGRVRSDDLENMIWEEIEGYLHNPEILMDGLLARQREQFKEATVSLKDINKIDKQIFKLEQQRKKIIDGYSKNIYNEKECIANLDEIRIQIEDAATIKANLESELDQNGDREARKLNTAKEILEKLNSELGKEITADIKQNLIRILVENITVYAEVINGKREALVKVIYRFQTTKEIETGQTDTSVQSLRGGGRCWQHSGEPAMLPKDKLVASR